MKLLFYVVPTILAVSICGEAQKFKGHEIGETTETFLRVEPRLKEKLDNCRATAPRQLSAEEVKKRYGKKVLEDLQRRQAQEQSVSPGGVHTALLDKDPDLYGERCGALMNSLVKGNGRIDGTGFDSANPFTARIQQRLATKTALAESIDLQTESLKNREPDFDHRTFVFRDGKLIELSLSVLASFDEVRDDLSKRLGSKPTEYLFPRQNAFGARWEDPVDEWRTENLFVGLKGDNNPAKNVLDTRPFLSVRSRAIKVEQHDSPSVLD